MFELVYEPLPVCERARECRECVLCLCFCKYMCVRERECVCVCVGVYTVNESASGPSPRNNQDSLFLMALNNEHVIAVIIQQVKKNRSEHSSGPAGRAEDAG